MFSAAVRSRLIVSLASGVTAQHNAYHAGLFAHCATSRSVIAQGFGESIAGRSAIRWATISDLPAGWSSPTSSTQDTGQISMGKWAVPSWAAMPVECRLRAKRSSHRNGGRIENETVGCQHASARWPKKERGQVEYPARHRNQWLLLTGRRYRLRFVKTGGRCFRSRRRPRIEERGTGTNIAAGRQRRMASTVQLRALVAL